MKRLLFGMMLLSASAFAEVKLAGIFNDNMVLQRELPVPVWGTGDAGEAVNVKFAGQNKQTTVDENGKWMVKLDPLEASFDAGVLTANEREVKNILVGEVWFTTGQSNMEWSTRISDKAANFGKLKDIRVGNTPKVAYNSPISDTKVIWENFNKNKNFSAVGYYFACELREKLNVPIGLVNSAWGGSRIEPWISPQGYELFKDKNDTIKSIYNRSQGFITTAPNYGKELNQSFNQAKKAIAQWEVAVETAIRENKHIPSFPQLRGPMSATVNHQMPLRIFNGRVAPIVPFAFRGVIWYQGESNGNEGNSYFDKKEALIMGYREIFHKDLAFYFVQLADFRQKTDDPNNTEGWPRLRQAQLRTMKEIPNTGMAVAVDIGDANDIHPRNKYDVGKRLSRWALNRTYGYKDILESGPIIKDQKVQGNKIILTFDFVGSGLMIGQKNGMKPTEEVQNGKLSRFAIAGQDKKFVWADAKIVGNTIEVSSNKVTIPKFVRYAFSMNPGTANLYNKEGLPASPFTTE